MGSYYMRVANVLMSNDIRKGMGQLFLFNAPPCLFTTLHMEEIQLPRPLQSWFEQT